jgi:hypothetical protein
VRDAPAGSGSGIGYLNETPRIYFKSKTTSAATDVEREALGLTQWWEARNPGTTSETREGKR